MNELKYQKLKKLMIKYYKNSNVFILLQGKVNTTFCIDKARILINKSKLIISNEDMDCTIDLFMVKKIKVEEKLHIEITYLDDIKVILEV